MNSAKEYLPTYLGRFITLNPSVINTKCMQEHAAQYATRTNDVDVYKSINQSECELSNDCAKRAFCLHLIQFNLISNCLYAPRISVKVVLSCLSVMVYVHKPCSHQATVSKNGCAFNLGIPRAFSALRV